MTPSPAPVAPSDLSELVARARGGDREAIEHVLAAIAPSVHRFGLRMCKNAHDAEDVLQETLISIASHLSHFEGRSSLSSWVFALTRSACARKRRGMKNRPPVGDERSIAETPDRAPNPEARAADHELADALSAALDRLSDEHREVILLRDIEGLSAPEAASSLGISVDALKSRLHRAREALRLTLRPMLAPSASTPPGCPSVGLLWSRKLEGELSQEDCLTMEGHLATCAACGAACDALKRALLACRHVREQAVPPEIQARVKAALRAWFARTSG